MSNLVPLNAPQKKSRTSGRPPITSQQAIIACAIALLEREPHAGVSLTRIAKTLNISPMSIYNYFDSRDKLLQALTSHLLAELQLPNDIDAPWQRRIIGWANAVRAHFQRVPYLLELLVWEGDMSTAWLRHYLVVNDVLRSAGLRNDALAQATVWVGQAIMSAIHSEIWAATAPAATESDLALPPQLLEQMNSLRSLVAKPGHYQRNFDYILQRLLDALALQINQIHFDQSTEE